jgi:type IV secretory pathway TrbF-like protein
MKSFFRKKSLPTNPYVEGAAGRQEWNDRYQNLAKAATQWRLACMVAMGMLAFFAIALLKLALASKVQPFVVETNQGTPYAIKPMPSIAANDQRLINFAVNQFIVSAKTIVDSTETEQGLLTKVYAFSANDTLDFLGQFYQKNNPFVLAAQYTITVQIVHAMPTGKHTWQVTWDESKSDAGTGAPLGKSRWIGYVDVALGDVNPQHINENPFGLYITHVSWSESQSDVAS